MGQSDCRYSREEIETRTVVEMVITTAPKARTPPRLIFCTTSCFLISPRRINLPTDRSKAGKMTSIYSLTKAAFFGEQPLLMMFPRSVRLRPNKSYLIHLRVSLMRRVCTAS